MKSQNVTNPVTKHDKVKLGCLCPKPDYIQWEDRGTHTQLLKGFGITLHGKKATISCEKCGQGLCGDCVIWLIVEEPEYASTPLCPTCAEVTK